MYLRLRQIALVTEHMEPALEKLSAVLGLSVCYRDPAIRERGLENALLPIGSTFIEVVAPLVEGTAAGRYLERRKGEGGFMFCVDCDNAAQRRAHALNIGVRVISESRKDDWAAYEEFQLHPRDTGGAMLSISTHASGEDLLGNWHFAGPHWQQYLRTGPVLAVLGADIQCADPEALARRWSEVLQSPVARSPAGEPELVLDQGFARFVPDADGRGEGLSAVHLKTLAPLHVLEQARRAGVAADKSGVMICGIRFVLH